MAARVRQVIAEEHIELAYAYHLRTSQYLADIDTIPRCVALQPAQILHFGRRRKYISHPIRRLGYSIEHARLVGYEFQIAQKFDRCLVISEIDWRAIDPESRLTNVVVNPHGVDIDYFAPNPTVAKETKALVFSGALSMDTNADAILYFCRSIYPLIQQRVPDVKLYVVGKGSPPAVRALATDPSIVVTGYVDDLRPCLCRAEVGIDPLRIGAGMQNKVLEGMAVGLPMVITGVANEGIGAVHGHNVLVADTPADFAETTIRLLQNPALRQMIGQQAREFVTSHWSWEVHFEPLERLFQALLDERARNGNKT